MQLVGSVTCLTTEKKTMKWSLPDCRQVTYQLVWFAGVYLSDDGSWQQAKVIGNVSMAWVVGRLDAVWVAKSLYAQEAHFFSQKPGNHCPAKQETFLLKTAGCWRDCCWYS